MKKYKCVDDLQDANFMVGEIKTLEEWKEWIKEMTAHRVEDIIYYERLNMSIEEHPLFQKVEKLEGKEIIDYIEKTYELRFEEVV